MGNFRKLQVWERAHRLTLEVYHVTRTFPKEELYGMTNQLRRASVSVPANIAEGCGRAGDAELARFLAVRSGPRLSSTTIRYSSATSGTCSRPITNASLSKRNVWQRCWPPSSTAFTTHQRMTRS